MRRILAPLLMLSPLAAAAHPAEAPRAAELTANLDALRALRAPEAPRPAEAPRCLTPLFRDLQRDLRRYAPAEQAEITRLLAPPTAAFHIDSSRYPLRVHFDAEADRPTAEDALDVLERSWRIEVDEIGFRAPLPDDGFGGSDALDVFILPGSGGAGAVGLAANRATPWNDWSTYITLDPLDYGGDLLGVTLAHEFNHCCQAAYDWYETIVALESTAVWVEDLVYDDVNDWYTYTHEYQALPHKPLDYLGGTWAWYVYAAGLAQHIVVENFGAGDPGILVDVWENSRQRGYRNEPDFLDAFDVTLTDWAGIDWPTASREIAQWRYFVGDDDDGAHLAEAAALGDQNQVLLEGAYTTRALPRGFILLTNPPAETASNLFEITVSPGDEAKAVQLTFGGDERVAWAVDALRVPASGPATVAPLMNQGQGLSTVVTLAGASKLVLVVTNLGDGVHDPEQREWGGYNYDLELSLTAAPTNP